MQSWLFRAFGREERVPLSSCVHYCGFRYGRGELNPYENYVVALQQGEALLAVQERFRQFLQYYRPRNFGAALGLSLERSYPVWLFPWARRRPVGGGWRARAEDCPDILTHFAEEGISERILELEFGWLEGALRSITVHGFHPERFRSIIQTRKLVRRDGTTAFLLLDGNHRVAALAALGHCAVSVRYLPVATVKEAGLGSWPQVRNGVYTPADARSVFQAYFDGNRSPYVADYPAQFIAPVAPGL